MPLLTRLEDQVPDVRDDDVLPKPCSEPPCQDVAVLVLVGMAVERGSQGAGRDGVLDQGKASARLSAPYQEAHTDRAEVDG
jgi:hypothetical protein